MKVQNKLPSFKEIEPSKKSQPPDFFSLIAYWVYVELADYLDHRDMKTELGCVFLLGFWAGSIGV